MEGLTMSDDKTKKGGKRAGSGRPKGSGVVAKNKVVRIPVELLDLAKEKGVKNLTALLINGAREILEGVSSDSGRKDLINASISALTAVIESKSKVITKTTKELAKSKLEELVALL